ncbi:CU044_2847 family protein [Streptomyces sp. NRRL F-5053]|uniref:CU044_2847 family protein n=1 Tax=Streptomyces sp. NRRL F-5053 TaxID=1463854 RepID=UPI0004CAB679|nr:CU044_2847 family protein [Streptomyces sp. NRRL F-5053]
MEREIREIVLPGGETVLARVHVLDEAEVPPGAEEFQYDDVGAADQLMARARQLNEVISGVGSAVLGAAREARPDEVSATFGVELAVKPGRVLSAVLADGEAKAAVSVTLTWHRDARDARDARDGREPAGDPASGVPEPRPAGAGDGPDATGSRAG